MNGTIGPEQPAVEPEARARGRLADVVHAQLRRLIQRGEFTRGLKLPAENELSVRFGVSRPVVREALARLKEEGFVKSQKGSGTIVVHETAAGPGGVGMPPIETVVDLVRLYEFRVGVESATATLAAERRTLDNIKEIEAALEAAEEMLSGRLFELLADVNFAFHRAIARATQNQFYIATLDRLPNFVGRNFLDPVPQASQAAAERAARIHGEHQAIFAAVLAGDGQRARIEMERHILAARDALLEGQSLSPQRRGG